MSTLTTDDATPLEPLKSHVACIQNAVRNSRVLSDTDGARALQGFTFDWIYSF